MEKELKTWTLAELAQILGGTTQGPQDLPIRRAASMHSSEPDSLGFAEKEEFLAAIEASSIGAVIISESMRETAKPCIRVARPREAFGKFLALCVVPLPIEAGIHPLACVSPEADVDPTASIGPYAVVEKHAKIGAKVRVYPFAYIGAGCDLGEGTTIYPHAVLYQDIKLGPSCVIHAGAVLGADGFGFVWTGSEQMKVPQVGSVTLERYVEVGANTTIDRATAGTTFVDTGTKFDNLVQVAHNVRIGKHTVIASQVGISGSTTIGDRVVIGGQAATSDHVTVGNDVIMGGRTGVTKDLLTAGPYWGTPAIPFGEALKVNVLSRKLPDMADKLRQLERRIAELEKQS